MRTVFSKSWIFSNSFKGYLQTKFFFHYIISLITDSRSNQLTFITSCLITLVRCSSTLKIFSIFDITADHHFANCSATTPVVLVSPTWPKKITVYPGLLKIRASCFHPFLFSFHISSQCQIVYIFVKAEPLSSHQILCQFFLAEWQIISKCTGLRQEFGINSYSAMG